MTLGRFATLPNAMSLARIALVPFIGRALAAPDVVAARPALFALFLAAFVTDWFDGRIARWTRQESGWGRILDPVADKVFVIAVAVFLVLYRELPAWAFAILAARDVGILLLGAVLMRRATEIPSPDMMGKIAMCVFSVMLLAYALPWRAAQAPLLAASVAFAVLSAGSYLRRLLARGSGAAEGERSTRGAAAVGP